MCLIDWVRRRFLINVTRRLLLDLVEMVGADGYIRLRPDLLAADILAAGDCLDDGSIRLVLGRELADRLRGELEHD